MTGAEAIARAKALPDLHAFITLLEAPLPAGEGTLSGMAVAVKDNIAVAGLPRTDGTRAFAGRVSERDAVVVARLRAAGAEVIGTLNMHEGALGATTDNPFWGRCDNPAAPGHTPGGSSGGSAAAVAAGIVPATLGTDTMGSVRIPAAYCGIWGLKPTKGLVPLTGLSHLSWTLDTIGPLAETPCDLARVLRVIAGPDKDDPDSVPPPDGWDAAVLPERIRLGMPDWEHLAACEPAVRDGFRAFLARLEGVELVPVTIPGWSPGALRRAGLLVAEAEAGHLIGAEIDAKPDGFSEGFRAAIAFGRTAPGSKLAAAYRALHRAGIAARRALAGLDALILPTAPQRAFAHGHPAPANQADFTALANVAGLPALAFPIPAPDGGLPCSAQLVGPAFSDLALIAMAECLSDLA
ncbi:MAG: amidase [Rubellimicrobium sp.]|nr:amidase [Rubellimicrobium sp.]